LVKRRKQQRRLADPWISSEQHERAWDNSAAKHAVQFPDLSATPNFGRSRHIRKSHRPRVCAPVARCTMRLGPHHLFDERVPTPAVWAFAKPFGRLETTGLADEMSSRFRHELGFMGML